MEGKKLRRVIFILVLLIGIINFAFAEEYLIQGIVFKGLKYTPYSKISDLLTIKPFQKVTLEDIEANIKKIEELKIFESVKYSLNKLDGGYELIIEVKEFPVISKIQFPSIRQLNVDEILNKIGSKEGGFFIKENVEEDIKTIIKLYKDKGYILKTSPTFSFKDNVLYFYWEELPPIKDIVYETKNQREYEILKEIDLRIGGDFNVNKIDVENQILEKRNIPLKINYKIDIENDGSIIHLYLEPLYNSSVNLTFSSPLNLAMDYKLFNSNLGLISFSTMISKDRIPSYVLSWQYYPFNLKVSNSYLSLSFRKEFSNSLSAEIGYNLSFQDGNKYLDFSLERNNLVKRDYLYTKGDKENLMVQFAGGGSTENYSNIGFSFESYWSYGEELEERILSLQGYVNYIIGNALEKEGFYIKLSYGFPVFKDSYIFLGIGGESNLRWREISNINDIQVNLLGTLNWLWKKDNLLLNSSITYKGATHLEFSATYNF